MTTEQSMMERVARAIDSVRPDYSIHLTRLVDDEATYTVDYGDGQTAEFSSHDTALYSIQKRKRMATARLVIEAMREPTAEMLLAAYEAPQQYDRSDNRLELARMKYLPAWRAAVDAALKP